MVVAHLGSGASLCGLLHGTSRETSMGFSTLDGIPMATRSGALDPGALLYLLKQPGQSIDTVEDMLYHRSGLLGLSGVSGDVRKLLTSDAPEAREALALYALRIAREVAAIATTLGGLDALVFTAGIGENQPAVRDAVCRHLAWVGVAPDPAVSQVAVLVMHTDEEQVIADEACQVLSLYQTTGAAP
ncbi:Acetate kinase [compost metagenome]